MLVRDSRCCRDSLLCLSFVEGILVNFCKDRLFPSVACFELWLLIVLWPLLLTVVFTESGTCTAGDWWSPVLWQIQVVLQGNMGMVPLFSKKIFSLFGSWFVDEILHRESDKSILYGCIFGSAITNPFGTDCMVVLDGSTCRVDLSFVNSLRQKVHFTKSHRSGDKALCCLNILI